MIICLVLSLGVAGESQAACNSGDLSCNGSPTDYCCWHVDSIDESGKRSISIYRDPAAPEGAIARVGNDQFGVNAVYHNRNNIGKITSVTIKEGVSELDGHAFYNNYVIESISMPYVERIGGVALCGTTNLKSLDMPNVQTVEYGGLWGDWDYISLPETTSLSSALASVNGKAMSKSNCTVSNGYKICGTCDDYVKSGTGCVKDCGKGYLGKEGKCIDSTLGCGENYKDMGGFCNRVRYTPAEAAEIAKDDGNVVTLTFRK